MEHIIAKLLQDFEQGRMNRRQLIQSLAMAAAAASAIAELVRSLAARSSLFIGWQDEGHDCERDQRSLDLFRARAAFDRFNQTNEPRVLLESGLL